MTIEQRWREIADKLEITETLTRYCRGLDRLDADLIKSAYHEGAMDHHGPFDKPGQELAAELVNLVRDHTDSALHVLSNVSIQLEGDVAWTESYMVTFAQHAGKNQDIGARFVDRFERRSGAWKIAERLMIMEFARENPSGEPSPMLGAFQRGARDRSDPSYQRQKV